jgi:murein DD-endopeptidase MepM/ murein hydrolase activator NlpD
VFNGKRASPHSGLDLRASKGDPVRAAGGGRVVLAESLYYSGNTVILDHGAGLFTLYAHLSEIKVEDGDDTAQEQIIGLAGATGRVTGPHLHWGAKIGDRPFDPSALLDPLLFK